MLERNVLTKRPAHDAETTVVRQQDFGGLPTQELTLSAWAPHQLQAFGGLPTQELSLKHQVCHHAQTSSQTRRRRQTRRLL